MAKLVANLVAKLAEYELFMIKLPDGCGSYVDGMLMVERFTHS